MRVLFVTGSYPPKPCGVGDYTRELAVTIAALPEMEVTILTSCEQTRLECDQGVRVCRHLPDWSLRSLLFMLGEFRRIRPDIVHVQYPTQGYGFGILPWLVPLLAHLSGSHVVQTWHERFNRRDIFKFLLMAITPGRTVVVREAWKEQFRGLFGTLTRWRHPICIKLASNLPRSFLTPSETKELKVRYGAGDRRLIVFFGFIHPLKRIELIFKIADPTTDQFVIIGSAADETDYSAHIKALSTEELWNGRVRFIGYVERQEAADCLKAADALILPFQHGVTEGNSSVLAGIQQGTFVLTTSTSSSGYDLKTNTYYAPLDGLCEMQQALKTYAGRKLHATAKGNKPYDWSSVASRHIEVYLGLIGNRGDLRYPHGKDPK